MKPPRLHEAISKLLTIKLAKYSGVDEKLSLLICTKIYTDIFDTLVEVLSAAKIKIDNEAMNYMAQCYYDGVLINNKYDLDPNIFDKRAKLENINTQEIALMAMMLNGTPFVDPLIVEVKKRS